MISKTGVPPDARPVLLWHNPVEALRPRRKKAKVAKCFGDGFTGKGLVGMITVPAGSADLARDVLRTRTPGSLLRRYDTNFRSVRKESVLFQQNSDTPVPFLEIRIE
ncbi:MAG: hypothetical protein ABSF14_04495 [Terriglobia bacterium]